MRSFPVLGLALALAACTAAPRPDLAAALGLQPTTNTTTLRAATLTEPRPHYAHATVRHAPQLADIPGGLPIATLLERPVIGRPWTIAWTTRPTAPFTDATVRLHVSTRLLSEPIPIPGSRGAVLQVPPDHVFAPAPGSWFTADDGRIVVDHTWAKGFAGVRLYMQPIIRDLRSRAGIPGPVIEIEVGNA